MDNRKFSFHPSQTKQAEKFLPAFSKNNIVIILSSSDFFAPYLAVCIQSIINCSTIQYNYDIIVFERNICKKNKKRILKIAQSRSNISVRFYNVTKKMNDINFFINSTRISQETYYSLLIPWLLPNYKKGIIMDCDMVVQRDIAILYQENLEENIGGGVRDIVLQGWLNDKLNDTSDYYLNDLKIKNPYNFVNGGLFLLDFAKYRQNITYKKILHYINKYKLRVVDQDIMNILMEGEIKALDVRWNHIVSIKGAISAAIQNAPLAAQKLYFDSQKSPYIIHYAGENKPWLNPELEFADEFWACARQNSFYETILFRMCTQASNSDAIVSEMPRSEIRILADKLLPKGTRRRNFCKKILPRNSRRWTFCKKIYQTLQAMQIVS